MGSSMNVRLSRISWLVFKLIPFLWFCQLLVKSRCGRRTMKLIPWINKNFRQYLRGDSSDNCNRWLLREYLLYNKFIQSCENVCTQCQWPERCWLNLYNVRLIDYIEKVMNSLSRSYQTNFFSQRCINTTSIQNLLCFGMKRAGLFQGRICVMDYHLLFSLLIASVLAELAMAEGKL